MLYLQSRDNCLNLKTILFDNPGKYAFLATNTNPGRIVTFEPAPKPLRLAVYANFGSYQSRLWQSAPLALEESGGWLSFPISQGTPANLGLAPGNYALAWQLDADESIPSFSPGNMNDGIQLPMNHGSFPSAIQNWTPTASRWSMYLDYTSRNSASEWERME